MDIPFSTLPSVIISVEVLTSILYFFKEHITQLTIDIILDRDRYSSGD